SGFVEGRNVRIEYRWALGQYDRLPAMATELVGRPVTVLTTTGGEPSALAAKAATSTIPVIFTVGGDPVEMGLVASYSRPGGNATGVSLLTSPVEQKRVELLRDMMPHATIIGFLLNPNLPQSERQVSDVQDAARAMSLQVHILRASTDREIDSAFEAVGAHSIQALAVSADPFLDTRREKLLSLAAHRAVSTMYHFREFAVAGGLVSYGVDASDAYRLVGIYTGRVLKGDKTAELPVIQATKFELVINLKTVALGKARERRIRDESVKLLKEVQPVKFRPGQSLAGRPVASVAS